MVERGLLDVWEMTKASRRGAQERGGEQKPSFVCKKSVGSFFGELPLMHGDPSPSTFVAVVDSRLWAISRPTYSSILRYLPLPPPP